jgi:hypothetical protein
MIGDTAEIFGVGFTLAYQRKQFEEVSYSIGGCCIRRTCVRQWACQCLPLQQQQYWRNRWGFESDNVEGGGSASVLAIDFIFSVQPLHAYFQIWSGQIKARFFVVRIVPAVQGLWVHMRQNRRSDLHIRRGLED